MRLLVAVALVLACRGDAAPPAPALVPALPASPDGAAELRALDDEIEAARAGDRRDHHVELLLERAAVRGRLEDYLEARTACESLPDSLASWKLRARVQTRLHRFADARAALAKASELTRDATEWAELSATLDEATGEHARAAAYRARAAAAWPSPERLAMHAANLALAGRVDDALAVMPRAVAAIRTNPARLVSWLLFQWALLHEQRGEPAAARRFLEEAHRRLPGSVEVVVHLAEATRASGGDPGALVAAALADNRHPALLALAGRTTEARAEWERYVAALPEAFADHAARFGLAHGDARRALVLARTNLANRATGEARALVVEAALAANQPDVACDAAGALGDGARAHQFLAWRALSACGRPGEAAVIAARLGIPR